MIFYEKLLFVVMFCSAVASGRKRAALAFRSPAIVSRRIPQAVAVPRLSQFACHHTRPYRRSNQQLFSKLEEEVDPGKVEGTDLRIVRYPHPALRKENEEISKEELKDGSISQLAKEMLVYMYEAEGVGLAAPQVGVNKRLMVYNQSGDKQKWLDEIVMVNPLIVEFSDAKEIAEEGCLSFPGMRGDVERSKWIKVEALNLNGKKIKRKFTGWEARIFQHEYDHLDGVVYIDKLSEKGREEVQSRLNELIEEFGEGGVL